jgi:reorganizing factor component SSRP1-like protein
MAALDHSKRHYSFLTISISFRTHTQPHDHMKELIRIQVRIAASGMAWKASESERVVTVAASTIQWAQWIHVTRNYQFRIGTVVENKNGSKDLRKEKFDGFQREVGCIRNLDHKS